MEAEDTPTVTELNAQQRVARGAAWLDRVQPDWLDRIDLATLNLVSPSLCIAGQALAHRVDEHVSTLGGAPLARSGYDVACIMIASDPEAREHPYVSEHGFVETGWNGETHDAWVKLINERREQVPA